MQIELKQAYSFCQPGGRANQEDARYPDSDQPEGFFFLVCDGVGGQAYGEIASKTVCQTISSQLMAYDWASPYTYQALSETLGAAYDAVVKAKPVDSDDIATTMTLAIFHEGGVLLAHIGDSRIYHLRPSAGIIYRTVDHSMVMELVKVGALTPEQAINHPQSNVITRSISSRKDERYSATTINITDVQAGDYFLLCTDGVLHQLTDKELTEIILSDKTDAEKMAYLAKRSEDSTDNNTATLIGVESVIKTIKEEADSKTEAEAEANGETRILTSRQGMVIEVEPAMGPKLIERLKSRLNGWLKR